MRLIISLLLCFTVSEASAQTAEEDAEALTSAILAAPPGRPVPDRPYASSAAAPRVTLSEEEINKREWEFSVRDAQRMSAARDAWYAKWREQSDERIEELFAGEQGTPRAAATAR